MISTNEKHYSLNKINLFNVYEPFQFLMIRIPLLPLKIYEEIINEGATFIDHVLINITSKRKGNNQIWTLIRIALMVGNGDFLKELDKHATNNNKSIKLKHTLLRYLIRMTTRPTPYKLYSSVGLAEFGDKTNLILDNSRVTRTRFNTSWLYYIINKLESNEKVLKSLDFKKNPMAFINSQRIFISENIFYNESEESSMTSIRATDPVRYILNITKGYMNYSELSELIMKKYKISNKKTQEFLFNLINSRVLISKLRIPLVDNGSYERLFAEINKIPNAVDTFSKLRFLNSLIFNLNTCKIDLYESFYNKLIVNANEVIGNLNINPITTDSKLVLKSNQISKKIGNSAAIAAELLFRLTLFPYGYLELNAYKKKFQAEYVENREVPLLELLDPNVGIGPLEIDSKKSKPVVDETDRNQILMDLVSTAISKKQRFITLNQQLFNKLEILNKIDNFPPSLDLFVTVISKSSEDLDNGKFDMLVSPGVGSLEAGSVFSRFTHIFKDNLTAPFAVVSEIEKKYEPKKLHVELVSVPKKLDALDIALRPFTYEYQIDIGTNDTAPEINSIPLNELVVGIYKNRFYLYWPRLKKELIIHQRSMLNPQLLPKIAYFLIAISKENQRLLSSFDWGIAKSLPFLPSLKYDNIILSPATWKIDQELIYKNFDLSNLSKFIETLKEWRELWNVPRYVYMRYFDEGLLLDLECIEHIDELRIELLKIKLKNVIILEESYHNLDKTWLNKNNENYLTELAIPLKLKDEALDNKCNKIQHVNIKHYRRNIDIKQRYKTPGTDWIYIKLYCNKEIEDRLLSNEIRNFCTTTLSKKLIKYYFFIRYSDPKSHIRLRFKLTNKKQLNVFLPALLLFGNDMTAHGICTKFSLDTYEREIERYGGKRCISMLENLFYINSKTVIDILNLLNRTNKITNQMYKISSAFLIDNTLSSLGISVNKRFEIYYMITKELKQKLGTDKSSIYLIRNLILSSGCNIDMVIGVDGLSKTITMDSDKIAGLLKRFKQLKLNKDFTTKNFTLYSSYIHMCCNRLGLNSEQEKTVMIMLKRAI